MPIRVITLTKDVYHIQPKKRKNSCAYSGVFSKVMLGEMMISIILGSLLAILDIIQRRQFKYNKMKNNIRLVMSEIITKL